MATATHSGDTITFDAGPGEQAVARSAITTADEDSPVIFKFEVRRAGLILRIGSSAGAQDILPDRYFPPGLHTYRITPGHSTYYVEWIKRTRGVAELVGFDRLPSGVLALDSVFGADQASKIRYAQSLNAMWLTSSDGSVEPQVLQRRGLDSWSLVPFRPSDGPFGPRNFSDTTITPSGRVDTVTLTASTAIFRAEDKGGLIRLEHPGQVEIADLTAVDQATDEIRVTGIEASRNFTIRISGTFTGSLLLERSVGNTLSWQTVRSFNVASTTSYNDTYDNQVIYYRLRCASLSDGAASVELDYGSGFTEGIGRIVSVDADNEVTVDVIEPFARTAATSIWAFGAWSARFGHVETVGFEDGRLWFQRGNTYWASASDDFEQFGIGTLADAPLSRTVGGRMNRARWMCGVNGSLLSGTTGAEVSIGSNSFDEVVTPSNVKSRVRSNRGSADANPEVLDDRVAFISRNRQRIYSFGEGGDQPVVMHLTRLHRDLGRRSAFRQLAFAQEEEPRLWIAQEDGQAAVMVYDLEEGVFAFWRYRVNGRIRSVCSLPGHSEDTVLFVVEREIEGETQYSIERLSDEAWSDLSQVCRLHGAVRYDGPETTTLSNLDHLEGREVYVWSGRVQGPFTVSGGAITLDKAVTQAIVGENYLGRYKSSRLNIGQLSAFKAVKKLAFWVNRTVAGSFTWGRDFENQTDRHVERRDRVLDGPLAIVSEDEEFAFQGARERDAAVCIVMDMPVPCEILALGPTLESDGR